MLDPRVLLFLREWSIPPPTLRWKVCLYQEPRLWLWAKKLFNIWFPYIQNPWRLTGKVSSIIKNDCSYSSTLFLRRHVSHLFMYVVVVIFFLFLGHICFYFIMNFSIFTLRTYTFLISYLRLSFIIVGICSVIHLFVASEEVFACCVDALLSLFPYLHCLSYTVINFPHFFV